MRFKFLAILSLAAVLVTPTFAATRIDDPVKFVGALYAQMASSSLKTPYVAPVDIYTPRLAALFALDTREAGGEVGRIDFDFWINAQDWDLSAVKVRAAPVEGVKDREVVIATFKNFGKPEEIHFYFEKIGGRWLLDDACSLKGETWTLSLILKYGWDGK
jgi:Protein of unknown function (DUF3828)